MSACISLVCLVCAARPSKPFLSKVTELKQLELICQSEGFPSPTITWRRCTELLEDDGTRLSITYAIEDGTAVTSRLVLTDLTLGDSGVYTCSASADILGNTLTASESVSVTAGICRSKCFLWHMVHAHCIGGFSPPKNVIILPK